MIESFVFTNLDDCVLFLYDEAKCQNIISCFVTRISIQVSKGIRHLFKKIFFKATLVYFIFHCKKK